MAEVDLISLLRGQLDVMESEVETTHQREYGVTLGIVSDIDDRENLGRVKVRFPWLSDRVESGWARIATPWAGQRRGSYFLPEVDDEVLVAFRHGDLAYPYVIGFLWSQKDPPPEETPRRNRRELRSRRGSLLVFDDTKGKESVEVRTPSGYRVLLDDGGGSISVSDPQGMLEISVSGQDKKISITANIGDLSLSAPLGKVSIDGLSVDVSASGELRLGGQPINLNPPGGS